MNMNKQELKDMYSLLFPDFPDVVSVSQMQAMLRISRHAAYDLVRSGVIPALKIGTSFRILKINIINYMLSNSKD